MELSKTLKIKKLPLTLILWIVAVIITSLYILYENDPYDPLRGTAVFSSGTEVEYSLVRSRVTKRDLPVAVRTADAVSGYVEYRRVSSDDEWQHVVMDRRKLPVGGHGGDRDTAERLAAMLPALDKMGGKYEFRIFLSLGAEELVIDAGNGGPIIARYRGDIPATILIPHIIFIMLSLLLGIRAALGAFFRDGSGTGLMWSTVITLLLGGFIFGPLVQWYAFGVLWSGVPFGWDLTDNKVLLELILWITAVYFNTGTRRGGRWSRYSIIIAGTATFLIYMIPHSLFGSAFNYAAGRGTGTGLQ